MHLVGGFRGRAIEQRQTNSTTTNQPPVIVGICETWLDSTFTDAVLVDGLSYSVFRKDRISRAGGGVCLLVASSLCAYPVVINSYTVIWRL